MARQGQSAEDWRRKVALLPREHFPWYKRKFKKLHTRPPAALPFLSQVDQLRRLGQAIVGDYDQHFRHKFTWKGVVFTASGIVLVKLSDDEYTFVGLCVLFCKGGRMRTVMKLARWEVERLADLYISESMSDGAVSCVTERLLPTLPRLLIVAKIGNVPITLVVRRIDLARCWRASRRNRWRCAGCICLSAAASWTTQGP